jgi:hypothetical protein
MAGASMTPRVSICCSSSTSRRSRSSDARSAREGVSATFRSRKIEEIMLRKPGSHSSGKLFPCHRHLHQVKGKKLRQTQRSSLKSGSEGFNLKYKERFQMPH